MMKGAGMSINSGGGRSARHAGCPVGDRPMDEENRPVWTEMTVCLISNVSQMEQKKSVLEPRFGMA